MAPKDGEPMENGGSVPGKKGQKLTKNQKRRLKKKQQKQEEQQTPKEVVDVEVLQDDQDSESNSNKRISVKEEPDSEEKPDINVEVEYISVREIDEEAVAAAAEAGEEVDPTLAEFSRIFQRFASAAAPRLSRKQRKKLHRLSVAELKQLVQRPEVVEAHDVTAADPRLLVHLKAYRGTVPVPRHWCHKRKYLQGKRGVEKQPWQLPDFIAQTGISKLRGAQEELDAMKRAKQKQRERVQPKMGKIDIDYQVLHDAFFKWQTKPRMTTHGELYYEGKEFEVRLRDKMPGALSQPLREALGMEGETAPPPWLVNMQRYGPPPSYPRLRIPGLTAPLPPGAAFGYHTGGWGKPPVDETGRPLYGDVFGTEGDGEEAEAQDRAHWGELEEEEEAESEEEDEGEAGAGADDASGLETPLDDAATGLTSVTSGLETPGALDLRKRAGLDTPETPLSAVPKDLYKVVQEQAADAGGGGLFGSSKKYVVPGGGSTAPPEVQVALNPDQLEEQLGDAAALREQYELQMESQRSDREDVSDIMADEARKRKRKLEKQKAGKEKKYKDFKF